MNDPMFNGLPDHPSVHAHMAAARLEARAAMARISQAIHPDDTVPADLDVPPHVPDLGYDPLHENPLACAILLALIVVGVGLAIL